MNPCASLGSDDNSCGCLEDSAATGASSHINTFSMPKSDSRGSREVELEVLEEGTESSSSSLCTDSNIKTVALGFGAVKKYIYCPYISLLRKRNGS